jgi:glycosyltransferase involved in cell wall biosynthesis
VFILDVVLRTFNRAHLLPDAVASLMAADRDGVQLHLLIVDNNSTDDTPKVLQEIAARHGAVVTILHEPRPGGQLALNTAIAAATAPVVAFFDDDERVEKNWLQVIRREFAQPETDFIAGPCHPLWDGDAPQWLPPGYGGVLGIIDNGAARARYSRAFKGMLTQGNCALRRHIFAEVGPYPDDLPTAEDRWLYDWLLKEDRVGFYCPDLAINHIMQQDRLNRAYFRAWAAREGRDRALCGRLAGTPTELRKLWYWRIIAGCTATLTKASLTGKLGTSKSFAAELSIRQAFAQLRALLT